MKGKEVKFVADRINVARSGMTQLVVLVSQALIHITGIGVRKENQIINASRNACLEKSANLALVMGYHLERTAKNGLIRL
jgi:hypothetical protein